MYLGHLTGDVKTRSAQLQLESKLGPEYPALLDGLWNIDPTSQDAKEIGSILDKLDDFCGS